MKQLRWMRVLVFGLLWFITACSPSIPVPTATPTPEPSPTPTEAGPGVIGTCLVTDVGRVNDGTFNQYAYEGMVVVSEDYGINNVTYVETQSEEDYFTNIETCINNGANVVITVGFLIQEATTRAAQTYPSVYFVGVDQFLENGPANYVGLQFREDQAGFLVGALAGLVAKEQGYETIGGVYGIDVPAVKRFRNGYEQGALYINPDWVIGTNILGEYATSFLDLEMGRSMATNQIDAGAQILFGAGGPLGSAAITAAAQRGVYVIGVDQDEFLTTFANGEAEGSNFIISSALKRVDQGVYDMVSILAERHYDDFPGGSNYILDVTRGGIGFADAHSSDIPVAIYQQVSDILGQMVSGEVVTRVDPVSGDLLPE